MTAPQLSVHPAAIEEAESAAHWYRERSAVAAARFVDELNQIFDKILDAPQRWPRGSAWHPLGEASVFSVLVIYRESEGAVLILAVAHGRRRPGYWKNRL
jgi:plasmid stabilization system protein ParE